MSIGLIDKLSFLFNGGRGIDLTQIDWSVDDSVFNTRIRQVHFVTQTSYNAVTDYIEGRVYEDVSSIGIGDLVFFAVAADIPNNSNNARLRLTLGGQQTNLQIFDIAAHAIHWEEVVPGVMHRAIRIPNGLALLNATGQASLEKRASRTITNAELKTLDDTYIELIPAPGAGQFIQVAQVFITKNGDEVLGTWTEPSTSSFNEYTGEHPRYRTGLSATQSITAAQLSMGWKANVRSGYVACRNPENLTGDAYFYLAALEGTVPVGGDLVLSSFTYRWPNIQRVTINPSDYTRLPNTIEVDGDDYVVYRLDDVMSTGRAIADQTGNGNNGFWVDHAGPTISPFGVYNWVDLGLFIPATDTSAIDMPFYVDSNTTYITTLQQLEMWDLLAENDGHIAALALGAQVITENQPVMLGMLSTRFSGTSIAGRTPDDYDGAYEDIDDVTLDIVIIYQTHSV